MKKRANDHMLSKLSGIPYHTIIRGRCTPEQLDILAEWQQLGDNEIIRRYKVMQAELTLKELGEI